MYDGDMKTVSARALRTMEREAEEACLPRQIAYCRMCIYEHMDCKVAYTEAGYNSKRPDVQSSKLNGRAEVKHLMAVYQEVLKRRGLISANNLQLAAYEVLEKSLADDDRGSSLKAIDQLTKMTGGYQSEPNVVINQQASTIPQMEQQTLRELFAAKRLQEVK